MYIKIKSKITKSNLDKKQQLSKIALAAIKEANSVLFSNKSIFFYLLIKDLP